VDPIATALDAARVTWSRDREPRALRCMLLRLLTDLDA